MTDRKRERKKERERERERDKEENEGYAKSMSILNNNVCVKKRKAFSR